ncbi:NADPH2:quinone reductase [Tamaricihabitans halophyticus]|uniref:NADPH2:quinone reductase n=1 Tax=Tamaricihabitans halophyticus TaxID=1262583 RepID=A0A4R2QKP1_9PSEU|nr:zinc-binding dehydrogenase [Tamaricihabitans halophyticus]TCP49334.1 NADPH2:quinone reductase [Tamaricihabitans halophyticus]
MRAVWLTAFGGPEVLVPAAAAEPVLASGEVMVEVAHANITFVETQLRAGGEGPSRLAPPTIPGNGVAGVVSSLGAGVSSELLGATVVGSTGGSGGYAERAAVRADALFPVPAGLALDSALALLADGRTATMLTRLAELRQGDRVLVEAAAGGVGSLLVQLGVATGARVVAAAGGAHKAELAADLGAEVVVDYREPNWSRRVRSAVGGVDVVFDGVGGQLASEAFELLDSGGRMVSFGLASGSWADIPEERAEARGVRMPRAQPTQQDLRACTEYALAEAAQGRLRPVIGQRFPLERAADAHAAIESRATVGKTLLDVS